MVNCVFDCRLYLNDMIGGNPGYENQIVLLNPGPNSSCLQRRSGSTAIRPFIFTLSPPYYPDDMNTAERKIAAMSADLLARFTSEFGSSATFLQSPGLHEILNTLRFRVGSDIACTAWLVAPSFRLEGAKPIGRLEAGFKGDVINAAYHA